MANPLYKLATTYNVDEMERLLKESTIFDKIEFSGIRKDLLKAILREIREDKVPARTVLLDMADEAVVEYWFKNRLHVMLRHAVPKSSPDKRGCSRAVLERDAKQDMLHFYENGQQNFQYTLADIERWLNS